MHYKIPKAKISFGGNRYRETSTITPIAFIIFNRPDTTARVFEVIRQVKPPQLFVIADGPRADNPSDLEKCAATRAIVDKIDWECEVIKNYSDVNLGCKNRVSSGLNWVFSIVEQAIILEDDCLPDPTFFNFCEELLEKYRNDTRIMAISGNNFQFGRRRTDESYYFSRYNHCWGWATWRRAWQHYDIEMKQWPMIRENDLLKNVLEARGALRYWQEHFNNVYDELINSWAFRWTFACWIQNGLTILPNVNLVSNIGFLPDATHTKQIKSKLANLPIKTMLFPLKHPTFIIRDTRADDFTQRKVFETSFLAFVKTRVKKVLSKYRVYKSSINALKKVC